MTVLPIVQALLSLVAVPEAVKDQVRRIVESLEHRTTLLEERVVSLEKDREWMKRSIELMVKARGLKE